MPSNTVIRKRVSRIDYGDDSERGAGYIPVGQRFRNGQVLFSETELDAIRAYANRLEPASVDGLDGRPREGKNKAQIGSGASAVQESL